MSCTFTAMCEHPLTKCNSSAILFVLLHAVMCEQVETLMYFMLSVRNLKTVPIYTFLIV